MPRAGKAVATRLPFDRGSRETGARLFFLGLAFVVYTCVFPYNAVINNPNENCRTYMTMAIVEQHSVRIDDIVARHGWVNDMARAPDKRTGEYHLYSVKGPAVSFAGVPIYWAFSKIAKRFGHPIPGLSSSPSEREWWLRASTLVLRIFAVQLPCFAFLVWFERWLRLTTGDAILRLCAVAAVGIGTNYLAYALMFVSHSLFAVAAFGSFAITWRERLLFPEPRRRRWGKAALAGTLAGLATLLEYHALPVSVVLAMFALTTFWRPTRLVAFGCGAALSAAALMLFQWRAFGNPLTPGHKLLENPAFAELSGQGVFGMGLPSWTVAKDLTFSRSFGFLGTSAFMWMGILAIPFALFRTYGTRYERRLRRSATLWWLLIMASLWVTVAASNIWRGGWTVGPRYLGAAPPFFAFGAVCALELLAGRRSRPRRAIARGVAGGLMVASVVQSGFVSIVFNTIPEAVTRPLTQFALPLARAGFVPHHAGELLGWMSPMGFAVVAGCLLGGAIVAACWPNRDRWWTLSLRALAAGAALSLGIRPALSEADPTEGGDAGLTERAAFAAGWEPPGRDRISTLREQAERYGPRRPCLWVTVAALERSIGWEQKAVQDEARVGQEGRACK